MEGCCYCHIFFAVSLCMPWLWSFLRWLYSRLARSLKREVMVGSLEGTRFFFYPDQGCAVFQSSKELVSMAF